MSFYGNVTYYLSNAFNKVIYRNANTACTKSDGTQVANGSYGPVNIAYEYALSPRSRNDDVILETGNHWIAFGDPNQTVGNNQVQIFHSLSNASSASPNDNVIQTTVTDTPVSPDSSIPFGGMITVPIITFDEAGHISNVTTTKYQLPEPMDLEGLDDIMHRLALVEYALTGQPGSADTEGGSLTPEETYNPPMMTTLQNQLNSLNLKVNEWDMTQGRESGDPYFNYREEKGIGSTLHDIMVKLGLRQERQYTVNETGETKMGYLILENAPQGTIIYNANNAINSAVAAISIAIDNRKGVNYLLDRYAAGGGIITTDDINYAKENYFNLNGYV